MGDDSGRREWTNLGWSEYCYANRVIQLALEQHLFPELGEYSKIRREFPYGKDKKSRVDFLLTGKNCIYLEVKKRDVNSGNGGAVSRYGND